MQLQMDLGEAVNGRRKQEHHGFIPARLAKSPTGEDRLMDSICGRENMREALKRVESNQGASGVDGMKTVELRGYLRRHWEKIKRALFDGTYKPLPARRKEIPKEDGGVRLLGIPTVLDRLIQQAIAQVLLFLWFDKELERRGLRFVRYADDVAIYVRTAKAAERVKRSISRFITGKLKLVVNEQKSAVSRPWHSKYLGFRITRYMGKTRTGIHQKSLKRFCKRMRKITARERGRSLVAIVGELNSLLRGWAGYFRPGLGTTLAGALDHWIRRRLRAYVWREPRCGNATHVETVETTPDTCPEPHGSRGHPKMGGHGGQHPPSRVASLHGYGATCPHPTS